MLTQHSGNEKKNNAVFVMFNIDIQTKECHMCHEYDMIRKQSWI